MTKTKMKKAANNELIVAYVEAYSSFVLKYNEKNSRGIKMIQKECQNLEAELLERELLTEEDVRRLNM